MLSDVVNDKPNDSGKKYIEITSPAASSDPYYTTMVVLTAVYDMLSRGKFNSATAKFSTPNAIQAPHKYKESYEPNASVESKYLERFFGGERRILSTLDKLETGLGQRFETAITAHPPHEQNSARAAHTRA